MHAAFFLLEIITCSRTCLEGADLCLDESCDLKADDDLSVLKGIMALLISLDMMDSRVIWTQHLSRVRYTTEN